MNKISLKKKIFNDPVYGFINFSSPLLFEIMEHPWFQRLRRIKQLGSADYVYPGALHTRFHHALGATHLMGIALQTLKDKGHNITEAEEESAKAAILLHDIGHGPFSHVLEYSILPGIHHEEVSDILIKKLNQQLDGKLDSTLKIFNNSYPRKFFHQLVSGQIDIDRLDYLKRDSFFTGVSEGSIGAARILKMLDLVNEELVIEEKGIYSIEHFIQARRLMYWQVYMHKTTICIEQMVNAIIKRARMLLENGADLSVNDSLHFFLKKKVSIEDFKTNPETINNFVRLDDFDIYNLFKTGAVHKDPIMSYLCQSVLDRKLFKVKLRNEALSEKKKEKLAAKIIEEMGIEESELEYLMLSGEKSNEAYVQNRNKILIQLKNGKIKEVSEASDLPNIKAISRVVKKYYLCHPKNLSLLD